MDGRQPHGRDRHRQTAALLRRRQDREQQPRQQGQRRHHRLVRKHRRPIRRLRHLLRPQEQRRLGPGPDGHQLSRQLHGQSGRFGLRAGVGVSVLVLSRSPGMARAVPGNYTFSKNFLPFNTRFHISRTSAGTVAFSDIACANAR